jgi:hypothetical protein
MLHSVAISWVKKVKRMRDESASVEAATAVLSAFLPHPATFPNPAYFTMRKVS